MQQNNLIVRYMSLYNSDKRLIVGPKWRYSIFCYDDGGEVVQMSVT